MKSEFPILYKKCNGKLMSWKVYTIDNTIFIDSGYEGFKRTRYELTVKEGKNIGKKNETSIEQQAINTATSKWNNKVKTGYSEIGNTNKTIYPMLATSYSKRSHDIIFPCYIQPKLDGVRGVLYGNKIFSRNGEEFVNLEHILDEVEKLTESGIIGKDTVLDGEIYSDTLDFQTLCGLVRKKKEKVGDYSQIKFFIFDIINSKKYFERLEQLKKIFEKNKFKYLVLVETNICKSPDDIPKFHEEYTRKGYEGIIIRNADSKYEFKRTKNLQKYKEFLDDEFKIVSASQGEGKEKGLVVWNCITKEGKEFSVRPRGTYEERSNMYKNRNKYIGKFLTVRYFEMTNDGIPKFPVGIAIRDYE